MDLLNNIWNFIHTYEKIIEWGIRILIGCGILFIVWKVVERAIETSFLRHNLESVYRNIEKSAKKRVSFSKQRKTMYGEQIDKTFLEKLDLTLKYCGLQKKYKWLTAELFTIGVTLIEIFIFLLACIISQLLIIRLLLPVSVIIFIGSWLTIKRRALYKATNKQISVFSNLICNFAGSSDDIIYILQQSAVRLKNPLRDIIFETCSEARRSGNTMTALKSLEDAIEYSPFKAIIRNLSIAARNEANYKSVIISNRDVIQNRILAENELSNIYNTARLELIIITVFGFGGTVVVCKSLIGETFFQLISKMSEDSLGQFILIFFAFIFIIAIYFTFVHTEKGGR